MKYYIQQQKTKTTTHGTTNKHARGGRMDGTRKSL